MKNQYQQILTCICASLATIGFLLFTQPVDHSLATSDLDKSKALTNLTHAKPIGTMPLLGEITLFAGNFAPRDFAFCNGQSLSKTTYAALNSVLAGKYGQDATTFNLPDFRGRLAVQYGTGISGLGGNLTPIALGEKTGDDTLRVTSTTSIAPAGRPTTVNVLKAPTDNHYIAKSPYLGLNYIICINGTYPSQ